MTKNEGRRNISPEFVELNMKHNFSILCAIFLVCVSMTPRYLLHAANEQHRKGSYQITFEERSPLSSIKEMKTRKLFTLDESYEYAIKQTSFEAVVPDTYTPDKPIGLFVWISAGDNGKMPGAFKDALSKHGFIFVGANNSGNNQKIYHRFGLAIDAVFNMSKLYNIDKDRIFISGNSGGGRCASMLGIVFPDVFTGGAYYIIGCNFYDDVRPKGEYVYAGFWGKKDVKKIAMAKDHYFVFLTGTKDFNREQTQLFYEAYKKDNFKHCKYIEVPDMGHTIPPAERFEEGILFLNEGILSRGKQLLSEGIQKAKLKQFSAAIPLFQQALGYGATEAQKELDDIRVMVEADMAVALKQLEAKNPAMARSMFEKIAGSYGSELGAAARQEIEKMDNDPATLNEKKAYQLFMSIRNSYNAANKGATVEALNKLISDYPDTEAAQKARETLARL